MVVDRRERIVKIGLRYKATSVTCLRYKDCHKSLARMNHSASAWIVAQKAVPLGCSLRLASRARDKITPTLERLVKK